ncbi:MAG: prefoldin subunit [Candidatus Hodarchaeales archaeon]|jgi:prefoldin beta subunit
MALRELSPAQQEQLLRFRQLEQTLQNLRIQQAEISRTLSEIELTKKELQKLDSESEVWQTIGSVMFPKKVGIVMKELTERAELLELKQKSFSSQEKQNIKRLEELQARLSGQLNDSPLSN